MSVRRLPVAPLAAGCCFVACLGLTAVQVWRAMLMPSDSTVVQASDRLYRGSAVVIDKVLDAATGLRAGDVITAVNGRPLAGLAPSIAPTAIPSGLVYTVARGGRSLDVSVALHAAGLGAFLVQVWPSLAVLAAFLLVGCFVFIRRPDDPGARDLLIIAGLMTCGTIGWLLGEPAAIAVFAGPSWWQLLAEVPLALLWGVVIHFLLCVSGGFRWAGWRCVAACLAVPAVVYGVYLALALPTAASSRELIGRAVEVSFPVSLVCPGLCSVLLVVLYLRATSSFRRHNLRLLLACVIFGTVGWLGVWVLPSLFGRSLMDQADAPVVFLPALVALAAAIVRREIFDLELLLTRSLLYVCFGGGVVAAFATVAWGLQVAWGTTHPYGVLLAAGAAAWALHQLATQAWRRVDRAVFGERHDPIALTRRLDGIEDATDPAAALAQVADLLASSLRLSYAEVTLDRPSGAPVAARHGEPGERALALPLTAGAHEIGTLRLEVQDGRQPFGPGDVLLLQTLQRQIGALATNALLTYEVQQSRDRIVRAREEERRQLHQRIHDGLGSELAAMSMQLEAIQRSVVDAPERGQAQVARLSARMRVLISELRSLIYGLRPPVLDQAGLEAAIRSRAEEFAMQSPDHRLRVEVSADGSLDGLPAAVEVAAYWIAVEAIHNVVKHAQARRCSIQLTKRESLTVRVQDDGRGLPQTVTPGGGMRTMTERAGELGGTVTFGSAGLAGTCLTAVLPLKGMLVA